MQVLPETFFREFALPLVAGGELHVSRPLDAEDLAGLEAELVSPTEESVAMERARSDHAAELWLYPVATRLDRAELELLTALHNLLFLSHPGARRWWLRQSSMERLETFGLERLERCPEPRGGAQLVSRHTLLANVPSLTRTDVEVRFWAGRRLFQGQEPPRRLMRWKSMRGVREHRQRVTWIETDITDGQKETLEGILRHSPLTDLLTPGRSFPVFDWTPVAAHLTEAPLCRLVCHRYLEQGLDSVGPALAQAFWRLVDRSELAPEESRRTLQLVGGLVVYLYAVTALTASDEEGRLGFDPQAPPTASLLAVLMAAVRCGMLPDAELLGGNPVHARLQKWAGAPAGPLGGAAEDLTQRLGAALAA